MPFDPQAESREEQAFSDFLSFGPGGPLIRNVEIFRTGDYRHKGKGLWTEAMLDKIVDHFGVLKQANEHPAPPIKQTHEQDNRGLPLLGFVEAVRRKGRSLFADFKTVSAKVADLIKQGAYRFRSAELHNQQRPWSRMDGSKLANVLRAVAFVPIPEVKGMRDIEPSDFEYNDSSISEAVAAFAAMVPEPCFAINFQEDLGKMKYKNEMTGEITSEDMSGQEGWTPFEEKEKPEAADEGAEKGKKDDEKPEADGTGAGDDKPAEGDDEKPEAEGEEKPEAEPEKNADADAKPEDEDKKPMADKATGKLAQAIKLLQEGKIAEAMALLKAGYGTPAARAGYGKPFSIVPAAGFSDEAVKAITQGMTHDELVDFTSRALVAEFQAEADRANNWADDAIKRGVMVPAQREIYDKIAGAEARSVTIAMGEDDEGNPLSKPLPELVRELIDAGGERVPFGESDTPPGPTGGQDTGDRLSGDELDAEVDRINNLGQEPAPEENK